MTNTVDLIKQAEQEVSQELELLQAKLEGELANQEKEWDETEKRLVREYREKEVALEKQNIPMSDDNEKHRQLKESASRKTSFFVDQVIDELSNSEN